MPGRQLQLLRDVGGQQRHRIESVLDVPRQPVVGPLAHVELGRLDFGERAQRLLRKHLDPAAGAPREEVIALGLELLLDERRELGLDRLLLGVRFEEERNREGVEARSISARPAAVRNAACTVSKPGRILVMIVSSSRLPPPNTVTETRPSVVVFHVLPMSRSALCQVVDAGASVARLIADRRGQRAGRRRAPRRARRSADV